MSEFNIQVPSCEDMVNAGMHLGRKKSVFHPRMKSRVYALKDNLYIIDLLKTEEALKAAIEAMIKVIDAGGLILFSGLTPQSAEPVKNTAIELNMPYIVNRWLGGSFTNFKTIIARVKYLENLEQEKASGGFEKYTKLERLKKDKEIAKLKERFDGLRLMTRLPDMLFVSSVRHSGMAIREARKMKIQIVGITNTDSDPDTVNYAIPANDNARKSVELIINTIKDALKQKTVNN